MYPGRRFKYVQIKFKEKEENSNNRKFQHKNLCFILEEFKVRFCTFSGMGGMSLLWSWNADVICRFLWRSEFWPDVKDKVDKCPSGNIYQWWEMHTVQREFVSVPLWLFLLTFAEQKSRSLLPNFFSARGPNLLRLNPLFAITALCVCMF